MVLIAQRNRGGLSRWPDLSSRFDLVVHASCGDEAAVAASICARMNATYGWPVLCVVMGATHARARIEAAVRARYAPCTHVAVVQGA